MSSSRRRSRELPHADEGATRLRHVVVRPGWRRLLILAAGVGHDRWMRDGKVQERVHGVGTPNCGPASELREKRGIAHGARRESSLLQRSLPGVPALDQPGLITIDDRLQLMRDMTKERQIKKLRRREVSVVSIAPVRRRDGVDGTVLSARQCQIGMVDSVEGQRTDSKPTSPEHLGDLERLVLPFVHLERHIVSIGRAGEHRRHARARGGERTQVVGEVNEAREVAVGTRAVLFDDVQKVL